MSVVQDWEKLKRFNLAQIQDMKSDVKMCSTDKKVKAAEEPSTKAVEDDDDDDAQATTTKTPFNDQAISRQ